MSSNYIDLAKKAGIDPQKVKTVFEIGSCHALDAIELAKNFAEAKVYAFEANPEAMTLCRKNIAKVPELGITLVEMAASDVDGTVDFFPFDLTKYDNIGASSMFKIDFVTNRSPTDADYGRGEVQKAIQVPSCRLDSFCQSHQIKGVDLICLDTQGAELIALKGLGNMLSSVQHVICECAIASTYQFGKRLPKKRHRGFFGIRQRIQENLRRIMILAIKMTTTNCGAMRI
ncbi:MAG: FkbM family methyltransferase [Spirochaetia bacterium]